MDKKQTYVPQMDTDSFIVYIKTEDIYSDIAKEVETWCFKLRIRPTITYRKKIKK